MLFTDILDIILDTKQHMEQTRLPVSIFFAKLPIYRQISAIYRPKNLPDLTARIVGHVEG